MQCQIAASLSLKFLISHYEISDNYNFFFMKRFPRWKNSQSNSMVFLTASYASLTVLGIAFFRHISGTFHHVPILNMPSWYMFPIDPWNRPSVQIGHMWYSWTRDELQDSIGSSWIKPERIGLNWITFDQIGLNWIKLD